MLDGPPKEIVPNSLAVETCNKTGIGCNREPFQVQGVGLNARVLLVGLIVYNVGLDSHVTRYAMHSAYLNIMAEIGMTSQSIRTQFSETEKVIEELHCAGIVSGGHSTFGGHRYASLRNSDSHKPIMKVNINAISVLHCPDLEGLLKERLVEHFKKVKENNGGK